MEFFPLGRTKSRSGLTSAPAWLVASFKSRPQKRFQPQKSYVFFPAGGENFWCSFGTKPFRNALFLVQKIYNAHQKTQKFASGSVGESSIMFYHAIMLCLSINSISLAKKFNCKYQSQSRLQ